MNKFQAINMPEGNNNNDNRNNNNNNGNNNNNNNFQWRCGQHPPGRFCCRCFCRFFGYGTLTVGNWTLNGIPFMT
jgi:hypothetical protein